MTPGKPPPWVHPTAIVEEGAVLGPGTKVWDSVHIRRGAIVGEECIIGEKSYLAYEVAVGDRVKINAHVYIPTGITLEDGVMVAAGVVFTNDRYPRAATADLASLRPSAPDESTERTLVRAGATLGAGAVIGPGLTVGRFAMVGMGAVVAADVPDHALVVGNPARRIGWVCRCGPRLPGGEAPACPACGRRYILDPGGGLRELAGKEVDRDRSV